MITGLKTRMPLNTKTNYAMIAALFSATICVHNVSANDPPPTISPEVAKIYVGAYRQSGIDGAIRLEHRNGYLTVLIPGRPPIRMQAQGNHEFRPEHLDNASIIFDVKGNRATGYTFTTPEGDQLGTRSGDLPKAGDLSCTAKTLTSSNRSKIKAEKCRLIVPENRSDPDSRLIELAFVRLISRAEKPGPPLIYLHGGPGGSAMHMARSATALARWSPFLDHADVILLDQRGCGESTPSLRYTPESSPAALFRDRATALDAIKKVVGEAAKHFRERGVDLAGYTTVESADDINDLRKALGVEKISLLGFSYGTHLSQATIRRHGEHLDSVVICGVEGLGMTHKFPLNMDIQLRKVGLMAAADPQIKKYVPDLYNLTRRVLDKLEKKPLVVEVFDRASGDKIKIPVGKFGLQLIMRFDIGDAEDLVAFPRLLHSIDQGDPTMLKWFVQKRMDMFRRVNLLTWVMDGASGAAPYRWQRINAETKASIFGDVMNFPYPDIADVLGDFDVGNAFREPLVSNIRTLFLSGTLDWNTPPYQAERVRWGFPISTHIIVNNAGHGQILPCPPIRKAVLRFLKGEDVSDTTVTLPPLRFVPIKEPNPTPSHPSVAG